MSNQNETMMKLGSYDHDDNVSCVTSGTKITLETAVETLTSGELELFELPVVLYTAISNGDIEQLHRLVTKYFTEDCLLHTATMDAPVFGIHPIICIVKDAIKNIPDFVVSATNIHFVPGTVSSPRCIVFDRNFVGKSLKT